MGEKKIKIRGLHEDRGVAALPAQVVRHCHQEAAEHREQHGDVVRLPGLLERRRKLCFYVTLKITQIDEKPAY